MDDALLSLKAVLTEPHACSYLPDQQAQTLFIDPAHPINASLYSQLSDHGFRRSGEHLYRPHCLDCEACLPCRIVVEAFEANRTLRRLWQRNQDLLVKRESRLDIDAFYPLYQRYIEARHHDGDMYPPSVEQFEGFLRERWPVCHFISFRHPDSHVLLAVAVVDQLKRGLSAIYTFFDPSIEMESRSLGTYAVLWQIDEAKRLGLPYVYLGYLIENCSKMAYKKRFAPLEIYQDGLWQRYHP